MSAKRLIDNLLRVAKQDLDDSVVLAARNSRNAAYLCEQAAEKIIRAVLTSENKNAGIGHQLDAMVGLVSESNPLKPALRRIEELAAYATAYRYPTSAGRIPEPPTGKKLEQLIHDVRQALEQAAALFEVDLMPLSSPTS
jgi:HEPN domain-containing protein